MHLSGTESVWNSVWGGTWKVNGQTIHLTHWGRLIRLAAGCQWSTGGRSLRQIVNQKKPLLLLSHIYMMHICMYYIIISSYSCTFQNISANESNQSKVFRGGWGQWSVAATHAGPLLWIVGPKNGKHNGTPASVDAVGVRGFQTVTGRHGCLWCGFTVFYHMSPLPPPPLDECDWTRLPPGGLNLLGPRHRLVSLLGGLGTQVFAPYNDAPVCMLLSESKLSKKQKRVINEKQ